MGFALVALILLDAVVVALLLGRPRFSASAGGRILAFVGLFVLPSLVVAQGLAFHLERSKSTRFCLSCHVMEPYGRSLYRDSPEALPAAHYQNRRIDRDEACYVCHTNYAMFGDLSAKWSGVKHLLVNYLGTIPEELSSYAPYRNRDCLHCHAGARSFEESETHAEMRAELASNGTSCLDCHDSVHDVHVLDEEKLWSLGGEP